MTELPAAADRCIATARSLLGATLASDLGGERVSGMIVEVEAYLGKIDPASHAYEGRRRRGQLGIWSPPGHWYVYRSYGIHWCLNLTSEPTGSGAAVLIRAIEPLGGIEAMRHRRSHQPDVQLANGPGKLCQALAVTGAVDGGLPGAGSGVHLIPRHDDAEARRIEVTPRIGISRATDWPLRFVSLPPGQ